MCGTKYPKSTFSENKIRQEIHTSSALLIGQRKGKKVRTITNRVREKLAVCNILDTAISNFQLEKCNKIEA